MNGIEQTKAMAKLSSSADKAWKPTELGGFQVGDAVRLPNLDCTFEVVALDDPILVLRAPSGKQVKAGWQVLTQVRRRGL